MVQRRKNRSYLLPWILSMGVGALVAAPLAEMAGDRFTLSWAVSFWFLGGVISAATFITHELLREERTTASKRRRLTRIKAHAQAA